MLLVKFNKKKRFFKGSLSEFIAQTGAIKMEGDGNYVIPSPIGGLEQYVKIEEIEEF